MIIIIITLRIITIKNSNSNCGNSYDLNHVPLIWQEDWALGYYSIKFRHFVDFS